MSFKVPTDIARLSDEALADLLAEGNAEFEALLEMENPSDQDVVEAERISPLIKQLEMESQRRTQGMAGLADRMNAVRAAHATPPEVETTAEPDQPVEVNAQAEARSGPYAQDLIQGVDESDDAFARRQSRYPVNPDQPANAARQPSSEVAQRSPVAAPPAGEATVDNTEDAVAASNGVEVLPATHTLTTVAARVPRPVRPQRYDGDITITASADIPDYSTGSRVEGIEDIAKMAVNRMRGFPQPAGDPNGQMHQYGVCTLRPNFPEDLVCDGRQDDFGVVMRAASEARLPGGSLVAAGGWCAPSETLYALCESETTEGMVSLPEVQVTRGGIRFTPGPDFSAIYADSGFCFTEAEIIAGATKPCYDVPCPSFSEIRLDACGTCVRIPILTNAAYPELVQRIIRGVMVAFQHQINSKVLAQMETILGSSVTGTTSLGGTFSDTLGNLQLIADGIRSRYRLSMNETLEVVAPSWLKGALLTDLANRMGLDNPWALSDSVIDGAFTSRRVNIQWVYDWQDLIALEDEPDSPCLEAYPETVRLLAYPAGTFVKGVADVINLNAVYDAASLSHNVYTGLFMEQGILLANTCFSGCVAEIPICSVGRTGAADVTCETG